MKKKAIGFINNGICIKDENDNISDVELDTYLPIILKKIDEWFDSHVSLTSISAIIFDSIKVTFDIDKMFKPNCSSTIVPKNNKLYEYLSNYVKEHPIYKELRLKSAKHNESISKGKKEYKDKNEQYFLYIKENSIRYDNIDRSRGFTYYK